MVCRLALDRRVDQIVQRGGVKDGITRGATNDLGHYGVEGQVHVNDLHATMLHLKGRNHEQLTFDHSDRLFRLTDVAGNVVKMIFVSDVFRCGQ